MHSDQALQRVCPSQWLSHRRFSRDKLRCSWIFCLLQERKCVCFHRRIRLWRRICGRRVQYCVWSISLCQWKRRQKRVGCQQVENWKVLSSIASGKICPLNGKTQWRVLRFRRTAFWRRQNWIFKLSWETYSWWLDCLTINDYSKILVFCYNHKRWNLCCGRIFSSRCSCWSFYRVLQTSKWIMARTLNQLHLESRSIVNLLRTW